MNFNDQGSDRGKRQDMENNAPEPLPRLFDINTMLLVILLVLAGCGFGFVFYQIHGVTESIDRAENKTVNVAEFQGTVNLSGTEARKK